MKKIYLKPEAEVVNLALTSFILDEDDNSMKVYPTIPADGGDALSDESPIWDAEY